MKRLARIKLIKVCAWCGRASYRPLGKNEEYTHGICESHKSLMMRQIVKDGVVHRIT